MNCRTDKGSFGSFDISQLLCRDIFFLIFSLMHHHTHMLTRWKGSYSLKNIECQIILPLFTRSWLHHIYSISVISCFKLNTWALPYTATQHQPRPLAAPLGQGQVKQLAQGLLTGSYCWNGDCVLFIPLPDNLSVDPGMKWSHDVNGLHITKREKTVHFQNYRNSEIIIMKYDWLFEAALSFCHCHVRGRITCCNK